MTEAAIDLGGRRCRAHTSDGRPCGRFAIRGGTVCPMHGGSAPAVRRAAALRLAELVQPALAVVARLLADPATPPGVKLRAAETVLDRYGFEADGHPILSSVEAREAAKEWLLDRVAERFPEGPDGDRFAITNAFNETRPSRVISPDVVADGLGNDLEGHDHQRGDHDDELEGDER